MNVFTEMQRMLYRRVTATTTTATGCEWSSREEGLGAAAAGEASAAGSAVEEEEDSEEASEDEAGEEVAEAAADLPPGALTTDA